MSNNVNALTRKAEQIQHYYPFGLPLPDSATIATAHVQPYKYNAKELDRMHGLMLYDYGARMYDPQLCRFTTPDRFADKAPQQSVYAYPNNPVSFVDVNGDSTDYGMNRQGEIFKIGDNDFEEDRIFSNVSSASTQVSDLYNDKGKLKRQHEQFSFRHSKVRFKEGVIKNGSAAVKYIELVTLDKQVSDKLFNFVADNTEVEWSYFKGISDRYEITTSHQHLGDFYGSYYVNRLTIGNVPIEFHKHSHPYDRYATPEFNISPSGFDWRFYDKVKDKFPNTKFYIRNQKNEREYSK